MLSRHIGRIALFLHRSVLSDKLVVYKKSSHFCCHRLFTKIHILGKRCLFQRMQKCWHGTVGPPTEKEEEWKKIRKKIKKKREGGDQLHSKNIS